MGQASYYYTANDSHIPCGACENCLFDIIADPTETQDLSSQHADIVKHLSAQLSTYSVYTSGSMSEEELAHYDCVTPEGKDPPKPFNGWPWGPPHYNVTWAGPCCFPKKH